MKKKLAFALMLALAALVPQTSEAGPCWIQSSSCYISEDYEHCCMYHCPSGSLEVCHPL